MRWWGGAMGCIASSCGELGRKKSRSMIGFFFKQSLITWKQMPMLQQVLERMRKLLEPLLELLHQLELLRKRLELLLVQLHQLELLLELLLVLLLEQQVRMQQELQR